MEFIVLLIILGVMWLTGLGAMLDGEEGGWQCFVITTLILIVIFLLIYFGILPTEAMLE